MIPRPEQRPFGSTARTRPHVSLWLCLLLGCILQCGCRSLPVPKSQPPPKPVTKSYSYVTNWMVVHIPVDRHRFTASQKLNPLWWLGNADEPVPPAWYRPGQRCRNVLWYFRNPFHNFDCYVIGISDQPFTRVGRYPDDTFNPHGGLNWSVSRYKCLRLPFISYVQGRFKAYAGWRAGGAFGLELKFGSRKKAPVQQPPNPAPVKQDQRERGGAVVR